LDQGLAEEGVGMGEAVAEVVETKESFEVVGGGVADLDRIE
jgi:hypothetical protein